MTEEFNKFYLEKISSLANNFPSNPIDDIITLLGQAIPHTDKEDFSLYAKTIIETAFLRIAEKFETNDLSHHYKVVIWADAGNDFFGNEWKYVDLTAPLKTKEEAEKIAQIISTYTNIWELNQYYNHPEDGLYTDLRHNKPKVVETDEPLGNPWVYFNGKPLSPKC